MILTESLNINYKKNQSSWIVLISPCRMLPEVTVAPVSSTSPSYVRTAKHSSHAEIENLQSSASSRSSPASSLQQYHVCCTSISPPLLCVTADLSVQGKI